MRKLLKKENRLGMAAKNKTHQRETHNKRSLIFRKELQVWITAIDFRSGQAKMFFEEVKSIDLDKHKIIVVILIHILNFFFFNLKN